MFSIGDLIIYSGHGICKVDDITDKTYAGITRTYYVLHPIENNHQLTINTPVDNKKTIMLKLINKEEAKKILESFKLKGVDWIEKPQLRSHIYSGIVNSGKRKDIAKVANTLMKKKIEIEEEGRKFYKQDDHLLNHVQSILFKELAMAMNTSFESIAEKINEMIMKTNE